MTSRERVLKSLNHEEPDRVPYTARLCDELQNELRHEIGDGVDYRKHFKHDILTNGMNFKEDFCEYHLWISYVQYLNYNMGRPLWPGTGNDYWKADVERLPLPGKEVIEKVAASVEKDKQEGYIVCNPYVAGIYEHLKKLMGDENVLVGMYEFPEEMESKIEKLAEWQCKLGEIYVRTGVDICYIGDDIGVQNSLIMSPDKYREFYKPYHKEIVRRIKKANPAVKVAFHCCGHITQLIPDFIDAGIDIMEAVQPEANNDLRFIKKEYGRDMSFWGAIGLQGTFYNKTPEEVTEAVCETLRIMSEGGGYIASPCHKVTPEIRIENIKAYYRAINEYGRYPNPGRHST